MKQERWKEALEEMLKERVKNIFKQRTKQELEEMVKEAKNLRITGNYTEDAKIRKEVYQERMELSAEDEIECLIWKS